MDKSGPFTHPPDDWINPGPITDADRIASYQRDSERDRKRIAELGAENAKLKEAAKQYLLGGHNVDCELNGYVLVGEEDKDPLECDCGYDELAALLEKNDVGVEEQFQAGLRDVERNLREDK